MALSVKDKAIIEENRAISMARFFLFHLAKKSQFLLQANIIVVHAFTNKKMVI